MSSELMGMNKATDAAPYSGGHLKGNLAGFPFFVDALKKHNSSGALARPV